LPSGYAIAIVCRGAEEGHVRALLLQGIAANGLHLRQLYSSNIESTDRVEVFATVTADGRRTPPWSRLSDGSAWSPA
jgi:putative Mg2+ transporter-C (MgtC) family protein